MINFSLLSSARGSLRLRLQVLAVFVMSVAAFTLPAGAGAAASRRPITLKTKHEYAKRSATFCGKRRRIRFFHRTSVIEYRGSVTPAPGAHFPVEIEVKRCVGRNFRAVTKYHFTGKKSGKVKGFSRAPAVSRSRHFKVSYFYARAVVNGRRSAKTYFAVTR